MDDLNDLYFFACVVLHNGFSAASRATGIEKTRLSRRVAALEQRLGVRLLQRSTRSLSLTEAGQRFYEHCRMLMESAQGAFDSLDEMKREPSGHVRISCPVVMAQSYLAPILPGYMATHPKVKVVIDATDREVNLIEERFDLALRASAQTENINGLVARSLGIAKRILVASPAYLSSYGYPATPEMLSHLSTIARVADSYDGMSRWELMNQHAVTQTVQIQPQLIADDLRLQLEAAIYGIGVALLPEPIAVAAINRKQLQQILPLWSGSEHKLHLLYPTPRGMLPSIRSLIDYLMIHLPAGIHQRGVQIE